MRNSRHDALDVGRPVGERRRRRGRARRRLAGSASSSSAAERASRARCAAGAGCRRRSRRRTRRRRPRGPARGRRRSPPARRRAPRTAAPSRQTATARSSLTGSSLPHAGPRLGAVGTEHPDEHADGAARRAAAGARAAADRPAAAGARGGRPRWSTRTPEAIGARLREEAGPGRRRAGHLDRLPQPRAARAARPGLAHPPGQGGAGLPRRRAPAPARRLPVLRGDRLGRAGPARRRRGTSGGRTGFHRRRGSRRAVRDVPCVPRTSRIGARHERLTPGRADPARSSSRAARSPPTTATRCASSACSPRAPAWSTAATATSWSSRAPTGSPGCTA